MNCKKMFVTTNESTNLQVNLNPGLRDKIYRTLFFMHVWQNGQSLVGCHHFVWSKLSQTFSISNMLTCTSHTALDMFCLIVVTLLPARCKHIFCHSSLRFILTLYWWQPITQSECQTQGTFLISDTPPPHPQPWFFSRLHVNGSLRRGCKN